MNQLLLVAVSGAVDSDFALAEPEIILWIEEALVDIGASSIEKRYTDVYLRLYGVRSTTTAFPARALRAVLARYREIILEVAQYYALPVLDLYAISGMQPENPVSRERLMPDGLHPGDESHALLARRIGEFLKAL